MLHDETRKLLIEVWNKTHNAKEIAERFSVNTSTVYRLEKQMCETGSVKTRTSERGRKHALIPDFAFNNELDESKFFSFEMESVAIDRNTNNMIVSVNANSPIAGDNGKHPGEDYIYRFSSIEFK